ncbi:MAG TPA: hypothetical protein VG347_07515 [Verrucomicrobiae bacterium]|nr:hypothetical protein [Verrucomicrobiae bacterium]
MKLLEKLNSAFRAPSLTKSRIFLAMAVAVIADGLQLLFAPFTLTFIDSAIDVVAMVLETRIIGFHLLLLPTVVVEFIPVIDVLPTWTACVAAVIALRKREQNQTPPTPPAPPAKPVIEI